MLYIHTDVIYSMFTFSVIQKFGRKFYNISSIIKYRNKMIIMYIIVI